MVIGSHNSWSYLPVKKWKILAFTAKCQDYNIKKQFYDYGVRCFDLRVRFNKKGKLTLAHGIVEYKYSEEKLFQDLEFLDNNNALLRIIHEVRNKEDYTLENRERFEDFCIKIQCRFRNIKCWCGKNLYNWENDYEFAYKPTCKELYASVCSPKLIDDWFPRLFAKRNNQKIRQKEYTEDILLIDFVNYGY